MLAQGVMFQQESGYILYVSDNDVDSGFVQLLQDEGYDVQLKGSAYSQLLTEQNQIDSAEGAALIILSRNLTTSDFSTDHPRMRVINGMDLMFRLSLSAHD